MIPVEHSMGEAAVHENAAQIEPLLRQFLETAQLLEEAHRRLEERVRELDRELEEKNRRLEIITEQQRAILSSMTDGMIAVDTQEEIVFVNPSAVRLFGWDAETLTGKRFTDLFARPFHSPTAPLGSFTTRDGRVIAVREKDSDLFDVQGRLLGKVKTFQDLTELNTLREQVRQADRLAALGEMAATVAHEIRNPLGAMRGFATFLAQDLGPTHPGQRWVQKILEGAGILERVVNELLEYTRPVQLQPRPIALVELVQSALDYVEESLQRLTLQVRIPENITVFVDADKIRQALVNLFINALEAQPHGGALSIRARKEHDRVELRIADAGPGVPPELKDKIFSPFFTTKEKGTGLGLALCKKALESHGGTVQVGEPEDGEPSGTVFVLLFPRPYSDEA
jgi:PAS domain S-box-containing protein